MSERQRTPDSHPVSWQSMSAVALGMIVMLVPIRVYRISLPTGFAAEPYRALLLLAVVITVAGLVRSRSLPRYVHGREIIFFVGWAVVSIAANVSRISAEGDVGLVVGNFGNLMMLLAVYFVVRSSLRHQRDIEMFVTALVVSAAVVSLVAIWEHKSGANVLDDIGYHLPLVERVERQSMVSATGDVRASASAQHPIALSVVLLMLLPLAIWCWTRTKGATRVRQVTYGACVVAIAAGVAATGSRTAVVVAAVMLLMAGILRPRVVTTRMLPALGLLLVSVQLLIVPGAISDVIGRFAPDDGLRSEQTGLAGTTAGGRLGDIQAVSEIVSDHPLAGIGYGSRVFNGDEANALILDNEYLGRGVEEGVPGVFALVGLVTVPIVRSWRRARSPDRAIPRLSQTPQSVSRLGLGRDANETDLNCALGCSFAGFAVSLLFFDGLAFLQCAIVFFILLAVSADALSTRKGPQDHRSRGELISTGSS